MIGNTAKQKSTVDTRVSYSTSQLEHLPKCTKFIVSYSAPHLEYHPKCTKFLVSTRLLSPFIRYEKP